MKPLGPKLPEFVYTTMSKTFAIDNLDSREIPQIIKQINEAIADVDNKKYIPYLELQKAAFAKLLEIDMEAEVVV